MAIKIGLASNHLTGKTALAVAIAQEKILSLSKQLIFSIEKFIRRFNLQNANKFAKCNASCELIQTVTN